MLTRLTRVEYACFVSLFSTAVFFPRFYSDLQLSKLFSNLSMHFKVIAVSNFDPYSTLSKIHANVRTRPISNQIYYLINCERDFYRAILVDLCHDVMWIRLYSVCIDAEMFLLLPNLVLHLAFLFTHRCIISRFTTRMLAALLIKVWIALQDIYRGKP
jgi:hypothetical protein